LSIEFSFNLDEGVKLTESSPDNDAMRALVTTLRQFISVGEPIYFYHIYGIVWQNCDQTNTLLKDSIASVRKAFRNIEELSQIGLKFRGTKLTPKVIIDLWFNGHIFHADVDKEKVFNEIMRSPAAHFFKFIFLDKVIELSNLMIHFANIILFHILKLEANDV
jgi:DNA-binding winged helix-turn-helix (wHTH) protein